MNRNEIESVLRNCLIDKGFHSVCLLEVKYGKMISLDIELQNEIQDGDFLSINISGWIKNYAFDLKRVTVVGLPTTHQKDYLDHLIEATNWMIQAIIPGKKMAFCPAESRGCLITPLAYELDSEFKEVCRINPREQFILPIGMDLCIVSSIKSPEFGTMTHSEIIVLMENGVEIH